MSQLNKQASACATVFLRKYGAEHTKTAMRAWPWVLGLGLVGGGAGLAYHKNQVRNSYTQGNRDLMAELRPLLAGLHAPRGGFDLRA